MHINGYSENFNKKENLLNGYKKGSMPDSVSIFSMMNKCIEKADTSGDGKLSEQEISVFLSNGTSGLIDELQKEMGNEAKNLDFSTLQQMFNMVKTVMGATAEISEDISNLKGMKKEDFINNANNSINEENSSDFWKMIGTDNAENIFKTLDEDNDGILSEEEISKISGFDGDNKNVSLSDIVSLYNTGNIQGEENIPEVAAETPTVSESSNTNSSNSAGGSSGGDSNYSPSVEKIPENSARTEESVQKEIEEQETLKTNKKSEAETAIAEKQGLIDKAVQESDLSDEFKAEYEAENTRLSGLITDKEKSVNEQKTLEQDYTAEAKSYESSITDISSQISAMEAEKSKLDPTKDAEKIAEYEQKINNLNAKKSEYEEAKTKAEGNAETAKKEAERLTKEKQDLETEKDKILDTLAEKYEGEKEKVEELKAQIAEYQTAIKDIKSALEQDLSTIDSNIQTLKNEKAQIAQEAKTKELLANNRVQADTSPVAANGDIANFTAADWAALGYDASTGNKLSSSALTVGQRMQSQGSSNNCLGGVKRSFIDAFGVSPFGKPEQGITSASKCLSTMQNSDSFREVTGITSSDQLKYLPKGAVIVWDSTGKDSAAGRHGHISISLGDGRESSDHICNQYRSVGGSSKNFHVFIPV